MNKWTNIVMDDDEFIHGPKPYLLLSTTCDEIIIMDDYNLEEKSLGKWQYLQHCKSIIPKTYLQGSGK